MADHSKPLTTSTYTNFVSELDARFDDLAVGLDPAFTTATNVPANTIRYSSAATKWQKWNGSSWADLAATYAISITGNAGTVTNGVVTTGSYSNPAWITSLAGSKISGNIAGNAASATVLASARNINGVSFNGSANISVNLNNSVTFNNAGAGAASGATFSGGSAITVSHNTLGAAPLNGTGATGTWGISITGNAGTVTNGVYTNANNTFTGTTFLNGVQRATNLFIGQSETYLYEHVQNALAIRTGPASAYVFTTIDVSGNFTAPGDVTAYSDERLKQNWRDLPVDFLERLAEVKMGIYDRKDTGDTQAGVSAQAMKALLPPVVREDADGVLSVAYGNAALASCVALAREFVELKARLKALEK
jgi:hypothetical protein